MDQFFKLKRPDEVFQIIHGFSPLGEERIPLETALDRILSQDFIAPEDLPEFFRSTMDGYAVKAKDTFGASESLPALLEVIGEVPMGQSRDISMGNGQTVKISTGGKLPEAADGVVMVEYCTLLDSQTLEVSRAVSPLENVIQPGDDFRKGDVVLAKGQRLRPQDLGVMAGLGVSEVTVFRKPTVAILSTGDEIVTIDRRPRSGEVRDINRYTLGALCERLGAVPLYLGLCPDQFEPMKRMVERGVAEADTVWVSGGSSVGTRDLTLEVFETLPHFEMLVHGISISPGKPTIIGRTGALPVVGLPGHVASALVVAEVFLTALISRLAGRSDVAERFGGKVEARLVQNLESAPGREDYIRVKLIKKKGGLVAAPVFGKSGLISTLVEADGLIRVDMNTEGLYEGEMVKVMLFDQINGGNG
jgi:molybdopterin molybdotransferase